MAVKESAMRVQTSLDQVERKILVQHHAFSSSVVQFGLDVLSTLALLYGLTFLKTGGIPDPYLMLGIITTLLMFLVYRDRGIYSKH
ncbi:MAG: hypothetical protein OEY78_11620, partial [Gammaproteobacteria bacterium]|nr:hypothetical protein [Gammaproteobacteria bacterium]